MPQKRVKVSKKDLQRLRQIRCEKNGGHMLIILAFACVTSRVT